MKQMEKIERLVTAVENISDPEARASAIALMQAVMDFHGESLDRMMEMIAESNKSGYAMFDEFAADERVASLLLLYGLHPYPIETRIAVALDHVRPKLDAHGGDVELLGLQDGVVTLRMTGSCKTCPSSTLTLKSLIEEAIYAAAPDVVRLEVETTGIANVTGGLVQIGHAPGVLSNAKREEVTAQECYS